MLTVDDDGIGVAPEHRVDAFAMFKRLHARSAYPGNGMGLALCRGIVDAHGGDISLEDSPIGGTRVRVRLPRTPPSKDGP